MSGRICTLCIEYKPADAFYPNRAKPNGLQSRCIACLAKRKRGRSKLEIRADALANFEKRFWSYVDKREPGDCWEWRGYRHTGFGYGFISIAGRHAMRTSHRVSWELHFGQIKDGLHVLHKCDNPPCVNPAHLYLGTPADNTRDMVERGRCRNGR